jgi:hypothetical protein
VFTRNGIIGDTMSSSSSLSEFELHWLISSSMVGVYFVADLEKVLL